MNIINIFKEELDSYENMYFLSNILFFWNEKYGVNAIDNISLVKGSRNLIFSCEMSIIPFYIASNAEEPKG